MEKRNSGITLIVAIIITLIGALTPMRTFAEHYWAQPSATPVGTPNAGATITNIYDGDESSYCSMDEVQWYSDFPYAHFGVVFDVAQTVYGVRWRNHSEYYNYIWSYSVHALRAGGDRRVPSDWLEVVSDKDATYDWNEDLWANPIVTRELRVVYTKITGDWAANVYEIQFDVDEVPPPEWTQPNGVAQGTPDWGEQITLMYDADETTACEMDEVGQHSQFPYAYFGVAFDNTQFIKALQWKNHDEHYNHILSYHVVALIEGGDPNTPAHWMEITPEKDAVYGWNVDVLSLPFATDAVRVNYTEIVGGWTAPVYELQFDAERWVQPSGVAQGTPNWGQEIERIYDGDETTACVMDEVHNHSAFPYAYLGVMFDDTVTLEGLRWKNHDKVYNHILAYRVMVLTPGGDPNDPSDWSVIVGEKDAVFGWNTDVFDEAISTDAIRVNYTEIIGGWAAPAYELQFDLGRQM